MPNLQDYKDLFVQPIPRYAVKSAKGWRSKNKPISDRVVKAHLTGQYSVACLARWYPEFAIIDFDDCKLEKVETIRGELGLDENSSMLNKSESADSFHLLFAPVYREKPPTASLLQNLIGPFARNRGIELYPQPSRAIRLPWGKGQDCIDFKYQHLKTWQERLYWFSKLDDFDISGVRFSQGLLDFGQVKAQTVEKGIFHQGAELFGNGLQSSGTRHDSQWKVIYYLWRQNVARDEAVQMVSAWIKKKNNGFSKDILSHPDRVLYEIEKQAARIYSEYDLATIYPDSTHNLHNGYIARDDVKKIILAAGGSLPRMRFLFGLIRYAYPRRHRAIINIHTDKLMEWSSHRTYQRYLKEFEVKGILERGRAYQAGAFSKGIRFFWKFKSSSDAVLYDGRSVDTFDGTVKMVLKPNDFRDMLKKAGQKRQAVYDSTRAIFA